MKDPDPFPWSHVMAFGLGVLRLPPQQFWSLTPRELTAAMGTMETGTAVPSRNWLDQVQTRYPDANGACEHMRTGADHG
ncbi:MAG: rcc01693 family protein [Pseudomonadota bacterium]